MRKFLLLILAINITYINGQQLVWGLAKDGGIIWNLKNNEVHQDHLEMSGQRISSIIRYGVTTEGELLLQRKLVFPMLRTIPNDTRGSLVQKFDDNIIDSVTFNGRYIKEKPVSFYIHGYLQSFSNTDEGVSIQRTIFPSTSKAAHLEKMMLKNTGNKPVDINIPAVKKERTTVASAGVYGSYVISYQVYDHGRITLNPGESYVFSVVIAGYKAVEPPVYCSVDYEFDKRLQFIGGLGKSLILTTPNDTINRMFEFAKLRTSESIFDTRDGLMHGPGGGDYYAAIWANDQAEYVNPFFPFLGNVEALESARNSFRLFARYMNPDYKPIPSSIIAEGLDYWNGAGDRGDQAMIAYGAALFALYNADTLEARKLWPLINWCNEYLRRQRTTDGVIASTSDELEGRFPAGDINLSTNVLTYGAWMYSSRLAQALGLQKEATGLQQEASHLHSDIEKYFGGSVEGYNTYKYYDKNVRLRSWICIPLVMGIFDRKDETIRALLSDRLWTKDGILTESGSKTFWDRSTLYAFRGILNAGAVDTAISYFNYYSSLRLLGKHVPYAIEAWPEGDQRHLAGESGLYCRVITEGLFGFEPVSFNEFSIQPRLPATWNSMSLKNIKAFNKSFDIAVSKSRKGYLIEVSREGKVKQKIKWDGSSRVSIALNN